MAPMDGTAGVRGHRVVDEALLDDPDGAGRADPAGMLRAIASAGAQVRESAALAAEAEPGRCSPTRAGPGRSWWPASAPPPVPATCWPTVAGPRCPVPVDRRTAAPACPAGSAPPTW